MLKLNIGSNDVIIQGWDNIDIEPIPNTIRHDARTPFPYHNESVDFIFSEHFIEHLSEAEGIIFFTECYRMLKPGGVIRTATFNIDDLMINLQSEEAWNKYKTVVIAGKFAAMTRAQFFNLAVYDAFTHKYMYNIHEMIRLLELSGFGGGNTPEMKESVYPELQNLEYRDNSTCIVEAIK